MKTGYEIMFMAPQNRRHHGKRVVDLVMEEAHALGITNSTQRVLSEGTGRGNVMHSALFFDLSDQPVELVFVVEKEQGDALVNAIMHAEIPVFCVRKQVEFGELGWVDNG